MTLLLACATVDPTLSEPLGLDDAWVRTFGGSATDEAWGLAATDDGVVFGAHASSPGHFPDTWVMRLDDAGAVWTTQWGGNGTEKTFPITVDADRVYVGGTRYTTLANETADGFVLALDANSGAEAWEWTFDQDGYEEIDDIVPVGDRLYIDGWSTGDTNDALVGALSTSGELLWATGWDSGAWDEANGRMYVDPATETSYVTGLRGGVSYGVGGTGTLAAFDAEGALVWMDDLPGCDGYCDGLGLAGDGEALYTVGDALEGVESELDLHAFTLDGDEVWSLRLAGESSAFGRAIAVRDGTVWVAANFDDDVKVLALDAATGDLLADATWAGAGTDRAHEIVVTDTAVYVAGDTDSIGAGGTDGMLLRFPLELDEVPPAE